MTTTTQILTHLSPVRIYGVDDWMKIAEVQLYSDKTFDKSMWSYSDKCAQAISLQRRYEEMTWGKFAYDHDTGVDNDTHVKRIFQPALLKKEMFVCKVEEPLPVHSVKYKLDSRINISREQLKAGHIREYESAKKKCWFNGWFQSEDLVRIVNDTEGVVAEIMFFPKNRVDLFCNRGIYSTLDNPTLHDFIYELDRYNRTATDKISITPTEYFVEELLKTE